MNINIDNKTINIEPQILNISHVSMNVFSATHWDGTTSVPEEKKILFNLKISFENEKWHVPFLVLLKKELKKEFVEIYADKFIKLSKATGEEEDLYWTYEPYRKGIFKYSRMRFLNKPYFDIFSNKYNEFVFILLNYIDSFTDSELSEEEYENIGISTFFNFSLNDIENISEAKTFVIREYIQYDNIMDTDRLNKEYNANKWQIPHFDFKKADFKSVKNNYKSIYLIVPKHYFSSYRPNFKEIKRFTSNFNRYREFSDYQGANIFYGSFKECYELMNNKKYFENLKKNIFEKRKADTQKARNSYSNSKRYRDELERDTWDVLNEGLPED